MNKTLSSKGPVTIAEIRQGLQTGSLTDFITLTKAMFGAGVDSTNALKVIQSNGDQVFNVDTLNGWVNIGEQQPHNNMDPNIGLYMTRTANSYFGINFQNASNGTLASTDYIMFNDLLNLNTQPYYELPAAGGWLDFGLTSSTYADPNYAMMDPNCQYLWLANNFYLGSVDPDGVIYLFFGPVDSKDNIKAKIKNGVFFPLQATEATEPAWEEGGIYYNKTKKKMYIGGTSGWEEVTSATVPSPSASPSVSPSASISPSASVSPSKSPSVSPSSSPSVSPSASISPSASASPSVSPEP